MPESVDRRTFLHTAGTASASLAAACAPGAAPPGTGTAERAGTASGWEAEWQDLLRAAKQEAKLSLVTTVGASYKDAVAAFEAAFPGITVEHTSLNASNFTPRFLQERKSGVNSYDAMTSTWAIVPRAMADEGYVQPIRSVLFRQDVLDDKAWRGGFEAGFLDKDEKWVYSSFVERSEDLWINTDLVGSGEITKMEDLLNPKWKGKIRTGDPRAHGAGFVPGTMMRLEKGDDFVKRLWKDQECAFSRDNRQLVEMMIRDKYAIAIAGMTREILDEFLAQGLGKNLKRLDVEGIDSVGGGSNIVWAFREPPHPNAAKLFVNWLLTKEAQTLWSKHAKTNSRRADVEATFPDIAPEPGRKYRTRDTWDMVGEFAKTQELAKVILN